MSSTGTAYDGTTRRGSQMSIGRVLSTAVSEPSVARTRRSTGSCRSSPSARSIRSCILKLIGGQTAEAGLLFRERAVVQGADWYPYPFVDPTRDGAYLRVALFSAAVAVAMALLAYGLSRLGERHRGIAARA